MRRKTVEKEKKVNLSELFLFFVYNIQMMLMIYTLHSRQPNERTLILFVIKTLFFYQQQPQKRQNSREKIRRRLSAWHRTGDRRGEEKGLFFVLSVEWDKIVECDKTTVGRMARDSSRYSAWSHFMIRSHCWQYLNSHENLKIVSCEMRSFFYFWWKHKTRDISNILIKLNSPLQKLGWILFSLLIKKMFGQVKIHFKDWHSNYVQTRLLPLLMT